MAASTAARLSCFPEACATTISASNQTKVSERSSLKSKPLNFQSVCRSPLTHRVGYRDFGNSKRNAKVMALSSEADTLPFYKEGELDKPRWSGDDPVSRVVNFLISIKPLFGLMKLGARNVLISTAEKNGISWRETAKNLLSNQRLYELKDEIEDKSLVYPSYYLQEFHAYKDGNLCWEAAVEVESATISMCKRAIPNESAQDAIATLRGGWIKAIKNHLKAHSDNPSPQRIIDIGCSAGISTRFLAGAFPDAEITGLDASPYFLAVAKLREEEKREKRENEIKYVHAMGEDTKFPSDHFDIVSIAFVIHECPEKAIRDLLKEAKRILKPGGVLAITDNSPKSSVIQNLPPALFVLMKSTEPWTDQYFSLDLEQAARDEGFTSVITVLTDPRHRTMTATA